MRTFCLPSHTFHTSLHMHAWPTVPKARATPTNPHVLVQRSWKCVRGAYTLRIRTPSTLAKLAILTWRYLYLLKMRICDFFKPLLTWVMTKNVDTSVTTPNFILTCSSRELLQLSGSRLPIQHSHTELQITLRVNLAAGLLHYSTSHASTALLMATELLYNTNNTNWCL